MAFGRRVRELRKVRGFSQEELAHRADIHWTYLGGIERGERNPALIPTVGLRDRNGYLLLIARSERFATDHALTSVVLKSDT